MIRRHALPLAAALLLAGCAGERIAATDIAEASLRHAPALTGDFERDRAELDRLEGAAGALARTDGCDDAGSCATIAVGIKACGGPRYHLVYCRRTTNEDRLRRQVAEIERFDRAMAERYRLASTCDFATTPTVEAVGGSCRATRP